MKKLFGYCLLNEAELEDLANTITRLSREARTAETEKWRLQRQYDELEVRVAALEGAANPVRHAKIEQMARRNSSEKQ